MHCYVFRVREAVRGGEDLKSIKYQKKTFREIQEIASKLPKRYLIMLHSANRLWVSPMGRAHGGAGYRGQYQDFLLPVHSPPQTDPPRKAGATGAAQAEAASALALGNGYSEPEHLPSPGKLQEDLRSPPRAFSREEEGPLESLQA